MKHPAARWGALAALAVALAAVASANASSTPPTTIHGIRVKENPAIRALLPERIRSSNLIRVASNAPYPPFVAFKNPGSQQFVGLDVDIFDAIGAVLGVRVTFYQLPFDGIIPAVKAGKYDAVMGGLSDTRERERVLDFVDYNVSGLLIVVAAGNPAGIHGLKGLCGKSVSAQAATEQAKMLENLNKTVCAKNKLKEIAVPQEPDAQLAVKSGRAQAELTGSLTAAELARLQPKSFAVVKDPSAPHGYEPDPNAIGVRKDDRQLRTAIQRSLQSLMDKEVIIKILRDYKIGFTAIETARVNGAPA